MADTVTGRTDVACTKLLICKSLTSFLYRKPVCLLAFLRFNRFACVAHLDLIEPNSDVNGHQAKPPSKTVVQANTNPEQLSLPRD
jgi:hypothetical protein